MGDTSKLVSISWPDHFRVFLTGMWTCFLEKYRTDLEVYCSGHRVNVHQVVLAIFCPVFKNLQQDDGQDFNLSFDSTVGLEEADLGLLIEFLYRGKINVSRDRLGVLREAGLAFGLQTLVDLIDEEDRGSRHETDVAIDNQSLFTLEDQTNVHKVEDKDLELPFQTFHQSMCVTEEEKEGEKVDITELNTLPVVNKRNRKTTVRYEPQKKAISKPIKDRKLVDEKDFVLKVEKTPDEGSLEVKSNDDDDNEEEEESDDSSDETGDKKARNSSKKHTGALSSLKTQGLRKQKQYLKCPHCSYGTSRKQLYLNHLDTHDRSVKRYVCDICSKAFRNNSSFGRHVYFHKNPDKLLHCTYCNYNTMQRSVWVQHLAIRHQLDPDGNPLKKDIRCPDCDFVCITDYQLKSHVMRKHSIKSFKCDECDYCSVMRADLEKHVQIRHRNDRPYMCETCGYRSKTRSHFNCHLQMHTGIKPFKCHICGQAYTRSNKLKEHLRSHVSDEKPFLCHLCSYACRRNYNLKLHIKRIHKDGAVGKGRGQPKMVENDQSMEEPDVMNVDEIHLVQDLEDRKESELDLDGSSPQAVIQLQTIEPMESMSEISLTTVCMPDLECLQSFHPLD